MRTGISNLKLSNSKVNLGFGNIYDLISYNVNNNWDLFLDKEDIIFQCESIYKEKITIIIRSNENYNRTSRKSNCILIELCIDDNKENILGTLAHEVTHASQFLNGFLDYEFNIEYNNFKIQNIVDMDYQTYYEKYTHKYLKTEHEAVLTSLFYYLEIDNMDKALELLFEGEEMEYFKLDFKLFIKKACLFGITRSQLFKLQELIRNHILYIKNTYQRYDLIEEYYKYLDDRKDVLKMLNIDLYVS